LPLVVTIQLLGWAFAVADNFLGKYLSPYMTQEVGFYFRGLSILLCLFLILLVGFVFNNFIGRRAYASFERFLLNIPFFKQVYPAIKEMLMFIFSQQKLAFSQVVLVEYPCAGIHTIGFLTNDTDKKICDQLAIKDLINVYIPQTPAILGGFLILIPKSKAVFLDMSIEEAAKIIVSGGVVKAEIGKQK
jgi:uncharacterized membrane protein